MRKTKLKTMLLAVLMAVGVQNALADETWTYKGFKDGYCPSGTVNDCSYNGLSQVDDNVMEMSGNYKIYSNAYIDSKNKFIGESYYKSSDHSIPSYSKLETTQKLCITMSSFTVYTHSSLSGFDTEYAAVSTPVPNEYEHVTTSGLIMEQDNKYIDNVNRNYTAVKTFTYDNSTGSSTKTDNKYLTFCFSVPYYGAATGHTNGCWAELSFSNYSEKWYYYKHITFEANGGTGSIATQTIENSGNLTSYNNAITRVGYTFAGWNTKADGTGTSYADGAAITATATDKGPVTLYAQWTESTTGTASYQHVEYKDYGDVSTNSNHDYVSFSDLGSNSIWTGTAAGNAVALTTSSQQVLQRFSSNSKATDCFDWFKVTFSAPSYTKVTYTLSVKQNLTPHTGIESRVACFDYGTDANGYWSNRSATSDGTDKFHAASFGGLGGETTTYYGEWCANYKFNVSDAVSQTKTTEFIVDNGSGSTISGKDWYGGCTSSKTKNENTATTTSLDMWLSAEPVVTYYKQVTFYANDGTSTSQSQTIETSGNLSAPTYTRTGYTFAGWNTKADGTGDTYTNGQAISVDANTKGALPLYAQWKSNATIGGQDIESGKALTLTDKEDLVITDNDVTVDGISYERELTSNWGTICLPFTVTSDEKVQYYTLKEVDGNVMKFTPAPTIGANTPAVFQRISGSENLKANTDEQVTLNATINSGSSADNLVLTGTFKQITVKKAENHYYIAGNMFWCTSQASSDVTIPAYRAYFKNTTSGAKASSFTIAIYDGDDATAIGTIDAEGNVQITDGKFINNGKVVIVKNGKKYNAAGQNIK